MSRPIFSTSTAPRPKCRAPRVVTAASFCAAAHAAGVDGEDNVRHIAHEVCHALEWELRQPWTNDRVHRASRRMIPSERIASEVTARAVERIVCERLGVSPDNGWYKGIESWAAITLIESARNGLNAGITVAEFSDAVRSAMVDSDVLALADRVLAIAEGP